MDEFPEWYYRELLSYLRDKFGKPTQHTDEYGVTFYTWKLDLSETATLAVWSDGNYTYSHVKNGLRITHVQFVRYTPRQAALRDEYDKSLTNRYKRVSRFPSSCPCAPEVEHFTGEWDQFPHDARCSNNVISKKKAWWKR